MLRTLYENLKGTLYLQFQCHELNEDQEYRQKNSLYYTEDIYFLLFEKAMNSVIYHYDYYYFFNISKEEFSELEIELRKHQENFKFCLQINKENKIINQTRGNCHSYLENLDFWFEEGHRERSYLDQGERSYLDQEINEKLELNSILDSYFPKKYKKMIISESINEINFFIEWCNQSFEDSKYISYIGL